MSARNPSGGQKFWFNGLPMPGLKLEANETGSLKFWFNGLPVQALYPPTLTLEPGLFVDIDTFYSPATGIDQSTVAPDLYVDTDAFHQPTVAGAAAALDPSIIIDSDTFHQPSVSAGDITLVLPVHDDVEIYYLHHVVSVVMLSAPLHDEADTIYDTTVTSVSGASLFVDSDTFYVPTVQPGEVALEPSLFVDSDTFYAPVVPLLPSLVASDDAFHSPIVAASVSLRPSLVSDTGTIYAAALVSRSELRPPLLVAETIIYTPVDASIYNVFSELHVDDELFYEPTITTMGTGIAPDLFIDDDVFYTPAVQRQSVHGNPGGGSGGTVTNNLKYATKITMDASGLITALQMVASTFKNTNTRMMIYADSAGAPGALLGQTVTKSSVASGTNSYAMVVPVSVLVGQVIWVALQTDGNVNWLLNNSPGGSRYNADLFSDGPSDPFGTSSVDNKKAPVLIVLLDAANATMLPPRYVDAEMFYAPVLSKTYSMTASLVQDEDFFYAPRAVGATYLAPDVLAHDDIVYAAVIIPGDVVVHPPFVETDDAAIIPVIGVGDGNIFPPPMESDDSFGEETSVTLDGGEELPELVIDDDVFLAPEIISTYSLAPDKVTDDIEFYDATVAPGSVELLPSHVFLPDEHWVSDLLRGVGDQTLLPEMIEDGDVFYSALYGAPRHAHRVLLKGDARRPQMTVSADNDQNLSGDASDETLLRGRSDGRIIDLDGVGAVDIELEGNDA